MSEFPKLPRKPLGYDPAAVERLIAERDSMLGLAEHRIRQAESQLGELEGQLRARDQLLSQLQTELETRPEVEVMREEPAGIVETEHEQPPLTPRFMTEELSKIVVAAEESTSQIIERAWSATRDQIVEADRLWREVQAEAVRFADWREEAESIVSALQSSIHEARSKIEEVPQRVQEALAPAVEAMVDVDTGMAKLNVTSQLPLLLTPSGLESARGEASMSRGDQTGEEQADDAYEPSAEAVSEDQGESEGMWADESVLSWGEQEDSGSESDESHQREAGEPA